MPVDFLRPGSIWLSFTFLSPVGASIFYLLMFWKRAEMKPAFLESMRCLWSKPLQLPFSFLHLIMFWIVSVGSDRTLHPEWLILCSNRNVLLVQLHCLSQIEYILLNIFEYIYWKSKQTFSKEDEYYCTTL